VRARYFYGYNIVGACFVIQAVSIGAMFTYGIFFKQFQADFGWSRATISGALSLAFLIMGAVGILAGRLNDRIGPKVLIVVSGFSLGLGFMLMSRLQAPWQLYLLYGVLAGIGFSTHDVITLSTVARWFVKRRGMMSGIVKVGTGTGQVLVPPFAAAIRFILKPSLFARQSVKFVSSIGLAAAPSLTFFLVIFDINHQGMFANGDFIVCF
jgi:MFS family permease